MFLLMKHRKHAAVVNFKDLQRTVYNLYTVHYYTLTHKEQETDSALNGLKPSIILHPTNRLFFNQLFKKTQICDGTDLGVAKSLMCLKEYSLKHSCITNLP